MKYKAQCSLDGKKWVGLAYPPVETREKAWNIIAIVKNAESLQGAQFRVKVMRSNKVLQRTLRGKVTSKSAKLSRSRR